MAEESIHPPRPFVLFALLMVISGAGMLLVSARFYPVELSPRLLLVVAAATVMENFALRDTNYSVSLSFPMAIAAMTIAGPVGAGLAALASFTNLQDVRERRPVSLVSGNAGQLLVSYCSGGLVYAFLGGPVRDGLQSGTASVPHALTAIVVAAAVTSSVNILIVGTGATLLVGAPRADILRTMVKYLPTQLALTFVGFLVAQVIDVSAWALPLFLFPLLLARQTYQRFATMREAYLDTVRSLVRALEAKDPYTRGHSERVARYAVAIAKQMNLDGKSIEALEQAALLHDIGKLALSSAILTKPAGLTPEECSEVRSHPARGAAMVTRIPPLKDLEASIRAHHERLDATGYPSGLVGEEIPPFARILAVADAYDAMTSNRAYRKAMGRDGAVSELTRCAGSQFDEEVVGAFLKIEALSSNEGFSVVTGGLILAEVTQNG